MNPALTRVAVLVATALVAAVAWRLGLFDLTDVAHLRVAVARVRAVPHLGLWFMLVYAVGSSVGVPVTPMTLAGGALFGVRAGIPLNWLGAMGGAILSFAALRSVGATLPARYQGRLGQLEGSRGALLLFQMRLVPVAPFALLNVAAAAVRMRWRGFVAATAFGVLPSNIIYTSSAAGIVAGLEGGGRRAFVTTLLVASAIIGLSLLLPLIARRSALPTD